MSVDLGFVEACEKDLLLNIHFPSKVGGRPAWLDLQKVPMPSALSCGNCEDQCIFLCQVYASLERPEAFHRTIYLFICPNEKCCQPNQNNNLVVFRNQIPRMNRYYAFDPLPENEFYKEAKHPFQLCEVCGCRGPFNCAKCKTVNYCGKTHQIIDWKAGHKKVCNKPKEEEVLSKRRAKGAAIVLLPEFEILLEQEFKDDDTKEEKDSDGEDPEEEDKAQVEEFKRLEKEDKVGTLKDIPETELSQFAEEEDKVFSKFRKRIADEPDQVLRYDRGGEPLWITEGHLPDVPRCFGCGGKRVFEFQIMPQLLNHLKCDTLDWGVLAVYTCERSCGTDSLYLKEFVHKQDIVKNNK